MSSLVVGGGDGGEPDGPKPVRRKRTSLEVTADVLDAALSGAKKTAIMYRANLSYELLNRYLDMLLAKRLLFDRDELGFFWVAPKGHRFLKEYKSFEKSRSAYLRKVKAVNGFFD